MIKLMDILNELKATSHKIGAAHETTVIKNVWSGRVPIYPKLMKKILGDVKINSFHVTDLNGLKNVKNTIGKKKSLSTFTAVNKYGDLASGRGVQTAGGIVLQLQGNLLMSSTNDIGSVPDESGRRWIHAATIEDYFGIQFSDKDIFDTIKKADKRWFELHSKYINWYRFYEDYPEDYPELTGKEKAEYIKRWIDGWEKFLVKNKKKFIKHFGQEVIEHSTGPGLHFGWNELVIYNIKIKDVFIVSDNYSIQSGGKVVGGEYIEDKTDKKEIMKMAKKVAGGKVIWGKTAGVPGFIKSRGGVVE